MSNKGSATFTFPFPCCKPRTLSFYPDQVRLPYALKVGQQARRACPQCGTKHTFEKTDGGAREVKLIASVPKEKPVKRRLQVVRVHDDGRRETVSDQWQIEQDEGRDHMREWPDLLLVRRERLEDRGGQKVLVIEVAIDDVVVLTLEEEWSETPKPAEDTCFPVPYPEKR